MDKNIYVKLDNVIKAESKYVMDNEKEKQSKIDKMNTLFNLKKILDNYDELEPVLNKFFKEKAEKEKFER